MLLCLSFIPLFRDIFRSTCEGIRFSVLRTSVLSDHTVERVQCKSSERLATIGELHGHEYSRFL